MLIVSAPDEVDRAVVNRSIAEAAEVLGTDPWTAFFDLVQAGGVSVNPRSMNEEQKWEALRAPFVMIDTDASPVNPEMTDSSHPRAFGAFPRVIAKYVRGVDYLLVNGRLVIDDGTLMPVTPGRVLRRGGS